MLNRSILYFIIFFFLNSCGFTPQFSNVKKFNYIVNINSLEGDRDLNNFINLNLKKYSPNTNNNNTGNIFDKTEASKTFEIEIITNYEKNATARDSTGAVTDYELKAIVKVIIQTGEIEKEISITETFKIKKIADAYEEGNYERSIKKNFASSISQKIVTQLSQIK